MKLLLLGSLFTSSFHAMDDKKQLLMMVQEHQRAVKRDLIALAVLAGGFAVSKGLQYMDQCGTHCPASHYLPMLPGALLAAHSFISCYLPAHK